MTNASKRENVHWKDVVKEIDSNLDRVWLEEPKELRKVFGGVIGSGAGSGKQVFSVIVHLEAYLMIVSQDILFRFMKSSTHENVGVEQLKGITREFLFGTFHIFEFLEDLGLDGMHALGNKYDAALDTVTTKDWLLLHLIDISAGDYWRAIAGMNGRLVTVSASGAIGAPLTPDQGRRLVEATLRALLRANPAKTT